MRNDSRQHDSVDTARRAGVALALAAATVTTAMSIGPQAVMVSRAVANLPTSAAAVAWGRAHDGRCDIQGDLTVTCASMDGGYTNAGTTVGNVWLFDELDGPDRHRHESRHSDQWAMFGLSFPLLYGGESARTQGDFHRNVFEKWAGLHDGGYRPE